MSRLKREICAALDSIYWHKQKRKNADNCFITCSGKTDGAGAQIQAILSTMLFANELGIRYVHTPFKKIAHRFKNDEFFESKWESFVNLGLNELKIDQLNLDKIETVYIAHPREIKKKNNTLFIIPDCHKFTDRNPNLYLKMLDKFHCKYINSAKDVDLHFDPSKINVAVHIRRGDVNKETSSRYTGNRFVLNLIKKMNSIISGVIAEPVLHIYSQDREENFAEFDSSTIVFHLNECPFTAFHHMVSADVLVMAKSSFSYSAALFSKGIKIYLPFWHKPLKDWVVVNKNDTFSEKKFKNSVQQKSLERVS